MKDAVVKESHSRTQKNMMAYLQNRDVQYIAEDALFKNMSTGEEYRGRAEIGGLLHYMYQVAFDAIAEVKNVVITEDKAMFDGYFKGRHIGAYNGLAATQKEVNVPLCVTYDLADGLIKEARIFMMQEILMQQLRGQAADMRQKTMYVTRDIFRLKFGHYKDVKALFTEVIGKKLMPESRSQRVLTDFTGDAYRLILEEGFESLADYESALTSSMHKEDWQQWYEQFKPHVKSSYREILKQVL